MPGTDPPRAVGARPSQQPDQAARAEGGASPWAGVSTAASAHLSWAGTAAGGCSEGGAGAGSGLAQDGRVVSTGSTGAMSRTLWNTEKILHETRPVKNGVARCQGGVLLKISGKGNCAGIGSMLVTLLWAMRNQERLAVVKDRLGALVLKSEAFEVLKEEHKALVELFLDFVRDRLQDWEEAEADGEDVEAFGAGLATKVVASLLEDNTNEVVNRPMHRKRLSLSRGLVIAVRIVELVSAPEDVSTEDLADLRQMFRPIIYDFMFRWPRAGLDLFVPVTVMNPDKTVNLGEARTVDAVGMIERSTPRPLSRRNNLQDGPKDATVGIIS